MQSKGQNISRLIILCLILVFISACYLNVIHGQFQFDDDFIVFKGKLQKDPFVMLQKGPWYVLASGTRLLPAFTYYFDYQIGGSSVEVYHVTSILWHLLTVLMVYLFVKKTFSLLSLKEYFSEKEDLLALSVAGLWGVHPIQTEAVSYISQRSEVMASFFYLSGILVLLKSLEGKGLKSLFYWVLGGLVFLCGWISKVIVVTLPVAFVLYVLFFMDRRRLKKAVLMVVPFLAVGAVLGLKMVLGLKAESNAGFHIKDLGQPEYFYTELRVMLTYLRLVFLPISQNLDYDYPIYKSLWDINVLGSAVVELLLVAGAFYTLRLKRPLYRPVGFGLLWFFLVLLPTSSVVPIKDVIFEHRLYLASMGVVIAVVSLGYGLLKDRRWALLGCVIVFVVLGFATYQRNFVWQSRLALWQDAVRKSPNKSRTHNNMGSAYYQLGQDTKALYHFKRAIELDPENIEAYYNMGLALEALGRKSEAVYYYMMFIQKSQGRYPELLKELQKKFFSGRYGIP